MKRSSSLAVLLCLAPLLAIEAQRMRMPDSLPPGVTTSMVTEGRRIFLGKGGCFNCHGPDAMGYLGPNLTDAEWWDAKGTYLAILQQINTGVSITESSRGVAMPPRGGSSIGDGDVQDVAAYVWRVSHPDDSLPAPLTVEMVRRGRQIFTGRGRCFTCHGPNAKGDIGPDLTDEDWLHTKGSYLAIVGTILTGVPAERARNNVQMPARGGANLSDAEVYAVAAYVWALGHQPQ